MRWVSISAFVTLLGLCPTSSSGEDAVLLESVLASGGGTSVGPEHTLLSTVGQPVVGIEQGDADRDETGFLYEHVQLNESDWADQNINNLLLTVTTQGIVGFLDASQNEGTGVLYPADGDNRIFVGSLWVGADSSYIANRDYELDPDQEWTVANDPDGHVWFGEGGDSDQDIHTAFTDSASAQPLGLAVRQLAQAWASSPQALDIVILRYEVENLSAVSLDSLYIGLFLDLDLNDYVENTGAADVDHGLVYMTDASDLHVGVRLLEDREGDPPTSNLTLIHNPTYVWPDSYIRDADKQGFLAAAGEEYIVTAAFRPDDWSLLASAGPLSIGSGDERQVGFAVVGGESLEDLLVHAEVAQAVYQGGVSGVPDAGPRRRSAEFELIGGAPNPFSRATVVRFELFQATEIDLSVYDVGGRLVRTLARGRHLPMRYAMTWDGRNNEGMRAPAGVYFLRLAAGELRQTTRVVCLR